MARIELEGLTRRYGERRVLAGVDLDIADGELFTVVGPSGCGKSTLLNLIAGLDAPDAGRIRFDGADVTQLEPAARDVAMVFQSYALYPHMSVYDNIAFPLRVRRQRRAEIDAAVRRVAATLDLEDLLGRRPRQLSGGQRQRVALGRALVRRPRAFLLDEPLSNLDARLRLQMRAEIKRLHRGEGMTAVYVTHDQEEAMVLADRLAVLHEGRLQQIGRPQEVYAAPANLFVAGFIGSPPMCFLPAAMLDALPSLAAMRARLRGDTVVGLRPADALVHATGGDDRLAVEVTLLEPTGADLWVRGRWRDFDVAGRAAPDADLAPGRRAWLAPRPDALHLFDVASGARYAP